MGIKVNVLRQENADTEAYWQSYDYSGDLNISVATLIDSINSEIVGKEEGERPIRWDCSCEQGLCGACAMVVNDRPGLSCQIFCDELVKENKEITIQALSKFPVVSDLAVDRSQMFDAMKEMKLWLEEPAKVQTANLPMQYEVSQCLMCGSCLEACPNYSLGGTFAGMSSAMSMVNLTLLSEEKAFKKEYTKRGLQRLFQVAGLSGSVSYGDSHCRSYIQDEQGIGLEHVANVRGAWKSRQAKCCIHKCGAAECTGNITVNYCSRF